MVRRRPSAGSKACRGRVDRIAAHHSSARAGDWGRGHSVGRLIRDIEFLLCRVERYEPGAHKIPGLDQLLLDLGATADHMPRGDNHTYGVLNPLYPRTRTYTGLASELNLIEALRSGGVGIESILSGLVTIATVDDPDTLAHAAGSLAEAWDPMLKSVTHLRRTMPLKEFAFDIIPWFVPIEIGGIVYRAPTGAQFSNNLIDWLLWGVDEAERSPAYRKYAQAFGAEAPRAHRALVGKALAVTEGRSLLATLPAMLNTLPDATGHAVLKGLDELLRGILQFRGVHQRTLAEPTLEMRVSDYGSGGQNEDQLRPLLSYSQDARKWLHRIRDEWIYKATDGALNRPVF